MTGAYEVLWPRGAKTNEIAPLAARLETLDGKTVCQLWDYLFRGDEVFALLEDELRGRFRAIKFVGYHEFGSTHGEDEGAILASLPRRLKELEVDAVISGMGC